MNWPEKTEIRRKDNPGKKGFTTGKTRERASVIFYGIRWHDGSNDYVAEDQLELVEDVENDDPFDMINNGRFCRSIDMRRSLTHVYLSGRLANLVYSMGVTNTDFIPYQYKPLLTLLESPADGILIADEVGLGKTIEAGLIWTELRAREDMRRLLVVCPAMLREKWKFELKNRFGVDSQFVNANTFKDELYEAVESGSPKAWIASYQSIRPPKSWTPGTEQKGKKLSSKGILANFLDDKTEEDPLIDLVVFDEAHYMRNPNSSAYTLGELLREVSHYKVLLSATPINLKNDDLYHLLKLCDPENFQFRNSFQDMLVSNMPLVKARDAALNKNSTSEEIITHVREASESDLLSQSRQLSSILENPPTEQDLESAQYRAEIAATLEKVNLLAHVVTRTRKRDVQFERPKRNVTPEQVPMSAEERKFYDFVTEATREFAGRRGISDGFLLATPQRQVCSCPAAFARAWLGDNRELVEDLIEQVGYDEEESEESIEYDDIGDTLKEFLYSNRPRNINIDELEKNDSKLKRLMEVLGGYFTDNPGEKVVLFTSFRSTALYLTQKLTASKFKSMLLWGGMDVPKQDLIDEFREDGNLRVLVSTEVASEGVDLQFCKLLINYDLPWNPMRIEQRIGRIDRLGQKSKVIYIWNIFYKDTIDERILGRLLSRLKIFEGALGEPEPIIGETIKKLESKLLTSKLSEAEENAEIERATIALENIKIRQDELEKNAAQMIAHGGLILDRISAAEELSRKVTDNDLIIYVKDFLAQHALGHQFLFDSESNTFTIQLPQLIINDLDEFCRRNGLNGQTVLLSGLPKQFKFINKVTTSKSRLWEVIHQFHPLIRFINERLKFLDDGFCPVVAVNVSKNEESNIENDIYLFVIRKWSFKGVKEEEWLQSCVCSIRNGDILENDLGETLVNIARTKGRDWLEASGMISSNLATARLDKLELHLEIHFQRALQKKQDENSDRMMFQINGIEKHLNSRLEILSRVMQQHQINNRSSLVKATQSKMNKLEAKMMHKIEAIKQREKITPDQKLVCVGVLNYGG
jgi:SNF2 family DNA or RNA helicase